MAPNVKLSFGPMLIGTFVNMILYGVLLVQTYHYYIHYKRDARWIKALVSYLFVIETLNTAIDMQIMWQPLIEHFGEPEATKFFPTMFAAEPITIVAISTPIQFFFAWRVLLLTKSRVLAGTICIFALVSLGGGIWTTALIVKVKVFARKAELHWSALVWFLTACIADILITATLVMSLNKKKTGFAATDDAIEKIIRMTVQTGAVTAVCAVGDVVFFMTMGKTALNFLWDLALTKLYANCLLSTLNARTTQLESTIPSHGSAGVAQRHGVFSNRGRGVSIGANDPFGFARPTGTHVSEYELDPQTRTTGTGEKSLSGRGDLEYGIQVTKVVETLGDSDRELSHLGKSSDSNERSYFSQ